MIASRRRNQFYSFAATALLLIIFAGFAPTLFLRGALYPVPPIPLYLFAHGFIVTGWFAWLLVQAQLAGSGRVATHRRTGAIGAAYAIAVIAAALLATFGSVRRIVTDGFDLDADLSTLDEGRLGSGISILNFVSGVVWVNIGSAIAFGVLVALAVALRRRPEAHKRLMLFASIAIVGPALARLARWPVFGGELGPFIPIALWLMYAAIIGNDLWTRRRPHPATLFGIALLVAMNSVANLVAASDFGRAFTRSLG
jgi:hypothetical protein